MQKLFAEDPLASRQQAIESPSTDPALDQGYDADFAIWLDQQVAALRARRIDAVDLENLIEELESLGRRDRRELASRLETLSMHLLQCEFQSEMKSGHWMATLLEQRIRIGDLLDDSPSLRARVGPLIVAHFSNAAARAALETGLSPAIFPPTCHYTVEQVLDRTFIP